MALQALIDSVDGLPDHLKSEYKAGTGELEGKFVLDVTGTGGLSLGNNEKLYNALESERGISKSLQKKLEGFKIDGEELTPEQAIAAIKKAKNINPADKESIKKAIEDEIRSGFEQKEKELVTKYQGDFEKMQGTNDTLRKQLHQELIVSKATKALIAKAPDAVELLLPHVERKAKVVDNEDGTLSVIILNNEGGTRLSPEANNNSPMSLQELVEEMSNDPQFAKVFAGSGKSGSGTSGGVGGSKSTKNLDGLTGAARLKALRASQS